MIVIHATIRCPAEVYHETFVCEDCDSYFEALRRLQRCLEAVYAHPVLEEVRISKVDKHNILRR